MCVIVCGKLGLNEGSVNKRGTAVRLPAGGNSSYFLQDYFLWISFLSPLFSDIPEYIHWDQKRKRNTPGIGDDVQAEPKGR